MNNLSSTPFATMGMMNGAPGQTPRLYFATPIEQCYSFYLAQQIFGVMLPVAGSISMTIYLNISGRNAVQFLTQSQVDRQVLRSLWSVADPNNSGSLTSLEQFQLLLRLVSLAQAGLITAQQPTDLSMDNLRSVLQQTAHQQLNLPSFSNVMMPTNDQLTQMYGYLVVSTSIQSNGIGQNQQPPQVQTQSIEDAFGGMVDVQDAPLPGLNTVPSDVSGTTDSRLGSNITADQGLTPPITTDGTGHEGGIVTDIDQNDDVNNDDDDDDDFGDFESGAPGSTMEVTSSGQTMTNTSAFDSQSMGRMVTADITEPVSVSTAPPPDTSATDEPVAVPEPVSFGVMEMTASDGGVPGQVALNRVSGVSGLSDVFSSAETSTTATLNNEPANPTASFPSDPPTPIDPLAAMPTVADDPLPGLGEPSTTVQNTPQEISQEMNFEDNEDDFGGFEAAPEINASSTDVGVQGDTFANVGATVSASGGAGTSDTSSMSLAMTTNTFDAFNEITSTNDPETQQPSLGGFEAVDLVPSPSMQSNDLMGGFETADAASTNQSQDNTGEDADDDTFGDFGSAQPSTSVDPMTINQHATSDHPFVTDTMRSTSAPANQQPPFPSVTDGGRSLSVDDAFGDIGSAQDAPLPSLEMFGSFDGKTATPSPSFVPNDTAEEKSQNTATNDGNQADPEVDFLSSTNTATDEKVSFQDTNDVQGPSDVTSTSQPSGSISDVFADMAPSLDAPLPSLGSYDSSDGMAVATNGQVSMKSENTDEDKTGAENTQTYGDFVAATATATEPSTFSAQGDESSTTDKVDISQAPNPLDIFESQGLNIQDEPLPSLNSFGAQPDESNNRDEEGDDDWGDFGGPAIQSEPSPLNIPPQPLTTSTTEGPADSACGGFGSEATGSDIKDDDFGDFESGGEIASSDNGELIPPQGPTNDVPEDDEFGDFGDFESTMPAEPTTVDTVDAFGDFESGREIASSDNGELIPPQGPTDDVPEDDEFGDFGDFKSTMPAEPTTVDTVDDFGGFGSAEPMKPAEPNPTDSGDASGDFGQHIVPMNEGGKESSQSQAIEEQDHWGDFGNFGSVEPTSEPNATDDGEDFSDFGSAQHVVSMNEGGKESSQNQATEEQDHWGDFGSASAKATHENANAPAASPSQPNDDDDDFGDFGSANHESAKKEDSKEDVPVEDTDEQDDWGDFGDFGSAMQPEPHLDRANNDDFGDFGDHHQSSGSSATPSGQTSDWGEFDNKGAATNSDQPEKLRLRDNIRSLSLQLPESLLRFGLNGDHVDLGAAFEANIGVDSPMDSNSHRSVDRCIQILQAIPKAHSKLVSTIWVQVFDILNEELEVGKQVLDSFNIQATSLSEEETNSLLGLLQTMCSGLSEYIRVSRSIVATIGDILMLDSTAMMTQDTWASTWCSLSILQPALEIEKMWREIHKSLHPSLRKGLREPPTVQEIRQQVPPEDKFEAANYCHLTLRPVRFKIDKATRRAGVTWKDRTFMACSANFLANRCPFFVIG